MSEELLDEIEVINSIYGPSTLQPADASSPSPPTQSEHEYILTLPRGHPSSSSPSTPGEASSPQHGASEDRSSLRLRFPEAYPAQKPVVLGTQHSAGGRRGIGARDLDMFVGALEGVYVEGSVCIFDALDEFTRRFEAQAQQLGPSEGQYDSKDEDGAGEDEGGAEDGGSGGRGGGVSAEVAAMRRAPEWVLSEVVVESKSTFVARVARITDAEQPGLFLAHLLENDRRVRAATHNMLAWRVRLGERPGGQSENGGGSQRKNGGGSASGSGSGSGGSNESSGVERTAQDFDDDGETAAGGRLLKLMQAMGVWDAMVVVTRWNGGVKLGPRRFAVINGVARDGFVRAGMVAEGKKKKR